MGLFHVLPLLGASHIELWLWGILSLAKSDFSSTHYPRVFYLTFTGIQSMSGSLILYLSGKEASRDRRNVAFIWKISLCFVCVLLPSIHQICFSYWSSALFWGGNHFPLMEQPFWWWQARKSISESCDLCLWSCSNTTESLFALLSVAMFCFVNYAVSIPNINWC